MVGKKPVLLLELGDLQVFTYQTIDQIQMKETPTIVFWQHRSLGIAHGPFPTVYDAMKHYTNRVDLQEPKEISIAPIIYVDFHKKSRIEYK